MTKKMYFDSLPYLFVKTLGMTFLGFLLLLLAVGYMNIQYGTVIFHTAFLSVIVFYVALMPFWCVVSYILAKHSYLKNRLVLGTAGISIEKGLIGKNVQKIRYDTIGRVYVYRSFIQEIFGLTILRLEILEHKSNYASGSTTSIQRNVAAGLASDLVQNIADRIKRAKSKS